MTGVFVTDTVAVPYLLLSRVEVAFTVRVAACSSAATASSPFVTVVPLLPPSTLHVTVWSGPFSPCTVAANCWLLPCCTVAAPGLMVTAVTVGTGGGVSLPTVTVAVPYLLLSRVEVAFTVRVVACSSAATVSSPFVTVVPLLPPSTLHVTVWSGPFSPCTVAANC